MPDPRSTPPDDDLAGLIARAGAGESAAASELVERVREPLLQRIRWMMGPEARKLAESDDFLHATFAAALPALRRFEVRGTNSFLRWLTTIARNQIRQELRRPREATLSTLSSALGHVAPPGHTPGKPISVDTALSLFEAFATLAEDERCLVEWHDLEGRTFVEIGALLGCDARQAARLHGRALLRLGRHFRGSAN